MRKVSCKVCREKWAARMGGLDTWYERHLKEHNLVEPPRLKGEPMDQWLARKTKWRQQYFNDSMFPAAPKTKLVCGKCGTDWRGSGSPAWCPACLTSSFAIAVKQE